MFQEYFPMLSPIIFAVLVAVLGFITPGYNHINYTISRLAIEKYGILQSINMLQLALGLYMSGMRLTNTIRDGASISVIRTIFIVCALFLLVAAVFPTDPIENVPLDVTLLTPTGLVHVGVVLLFFVLSPLGIIQLAGILKKQKQYTPYAVLTLVAGFSAFLGGIVWFYFYFSGIYLEYRGIFQKAIALPVLLWIILINYATLKKSRV